MVVEEIGQRRSALNALRKRLRNLTARVRADALQRKSTGVKKSKIAAARPVKNEDRVRVTVRGSVLPTQNAGAGWSEKVALTDRRGARQVERPAEKQKRNRRAVSRGRPRRTVIRDRIMEISANKVETMTAITHAHASNLMLLVDPKADLGVIAVGQNRANKAKWPGDRKGASLRKMLRSVTGKFSKQRRSAIQHELA